MVAYLIGRGDVAMDADLTDRLGRLGPVRVVEVGTAEVPATVVLHLAGEAADLKPNDAVLALTRGGITMLQALEYLDVMAVDLRSAGLQVIPRLDAGITAPPGI